MDMAQQKPASAALTLAQHSAMMALAALANPLIYYDNNPFEAWAITLFGAMIIASVLFGILSLIQPARAKQAFPKSLIKAAWLILVLMVLSKWQDYRERPAEKAHQSSEIDRFLSDESKPGLKPFHGKLDGE